MNMHLIHQVLNFYHVHLHVDTHSYIRYVICSGVLPFYVLIIHDGHRYPSRTERILSRKCPSGMNQATKFDIAVFLWKGQGVETTDWILPIF